MPRDPRFNLTGQRFGRLVVGAPPELRSVAGGSFWYWPCSCDCGKASMVPTRSLRNGNTKSCGCLRLERQLASRKVLSPAARAVKSVHEGMKARCNCETSSHYHRYGGRGIKVCDRWAEIETFAADMGPRPPGMTLERRDNDGDYEPDNCVWATKDEQNRNKVTNVFIEYDGRRQILIDWAREWNTTEWLARNRLEAAGAVPPRPPLARHRSPSGSVSTGASAS